MKKQRASLPLRLLVFSFTLFFAGYALTGFFSRAEYLRSGDKAGLFAFLTGDELIPLAAETAAENASFIEETETEEFLIFQPEEGAIPYRVAALPEKPAAESPPENSEPLKAITISSSMKPKNNPSLSFDADALLGKDIRFDKEKNAILIIHTHGSEAYSEYETVFWRKNRSANSEDPAESVVAVGRVLADALTRAGFRVIHDETMCDVPNYNKSYKNALKVIEKNMEDDKTIGMVLDIHRDSLSSSDGKRYKLLSGDGRSSQIMFVVGSNALLSHDGWQDNLSFALHLQKEAMAKYDDFVRPISISKNRYNMHATPCSLIVEFGTEANTLAEAEDSARRLAGLIAEVIG